MEIWGKPGKMPQAENPYGIDPNRLYTMEFVADLLSVEKKLIRWWIKKGVMEGIKLPNRAWRIRGIEIIRIIDQGRSEGGTGTGTGAGAKPSQTPPNGLGRQMCKGTNGE